LEKKGKREQIKKGTKSLFRQKEGGKEYADRRGDAGGEEGKKLKNPPGEEKETKFPRTGKQGGRSSFGKIRRLCKKYVPHLTEIGQARNSSRRGSFSPRGENCPV